MLESGFATGGQSQGTGKAGKLLKSKRRCISLRWKYIFLILVLTVVFFVYNTSIEEVVPDWDSTKWWFASNSQRQNVVSPKSSGSSTGTPGSEPTGFVTEIIPVALRQTDASVSTQQTTPSRAEPPTAMPYKSPGPYLVEYPSEYHFIINEPKTCEQQKSFLVLVVPVAPNNRAHRDVIRSTWGGEGTALGKVVTLFFLLGLHSGEGAPQIQEQLLQESREHHDLIQSDFLDCYKNLTIKTMVMLEWLDLHCSGASYAMKIDSDMFLNVPKLIDMLVNAPKTNYMTGLVASGAMVLRDRTNKWFLPVEIYPSPNYPRYALGLGYVLSLDLPKKLVEASRHVKAVYIEDVYLGLCMSHMGIPPTDPPNGNYFHVSPRTYSRCAYSQLIATTTHPHDDRVSIWKDFKRPGQYC
ncbi:beta-1,3-galactosyltransferase 2 [Anarrhichthys ocellatus]|uniref:beta-1,3-galactosyltransferase 2 n=1 Tax=Anarrhichthys ocellatus TaxID=433405 RepID=UPI0012EEAD84|nr:beta-1,3-galactosyltransferase 2-like [Anarrhichthys ocellatus]